MEQKFIEIFKETLEIEDHDVLMEDEFRTYPEWDSLAYLSVIAMLDEEYDMQIETEDFKKLRTIRALYSAATKE